MNYLFAGASSAIAKSCAGMLQNNKHRVIGLSTRYTDYNYDLLHQVESYSPEHLPELSEPLNGLVYFPGTIHLKPFSRLSREDFLNDLEINVLGAVSFVQKYLPLLRQSAGASVVFVSSVAAQIGMPFHTSISLSKGALEGLARAMAAELAPLVRVNCVAPSLVNTPLAERFVNTIEKKTATSNMNPLRKTGIPEDIAAMIEFLLSPASGWITGQVFAVDGGMNKLKN